MVRLFIDAPLGEGQTAKLEKDQSHYLSGVMRMGLGDALEVFDGRTGVYGAEIVGGSKRSVELAIGARTAPLRKPPDLWLLFAPIKKARTDFIVEKAAEMGAARILPVRTDHTNSERIRRDRLQAHAVEAAEQCGGTFVPEVAEMQTLSSALDALGNRALIFCDEALAGEAQAPLPPAPAAILIGPEGGFSGAERAMLRTRATAVSLGPRILRADTATVAALTLWQRERGDW